jgi:tetratricopeptide (TPR) repeat protein
MKKVFLLLIAAIAVNICMACLNEFHKDKYGNVHESGREGLVLYNEPDKKAATEFLAKYDLNKLSQYNKEVQSDIAVNLMYLGKQKEALAILIKLQKANPNDYTIAANLGTAYELNGNNEKALEFIKKGIQLNPDSHNGSEWVHVKVLEAKLLMKDDADWLSKNKVLNTGVHFNSKGNEHLENKIWQIEYQLKERVPFTPFPDKLLANVFDELGDLYATQESAALAYMAYDFSLQYDPADLYDTKKKMEELKIILKKQKTAIPSWKQHYYNRKLDKIQSEIIGEVIEAITNSDSLEKKIAGFKPMIDFISGEKARREKERKRKLNLFLTGMGTVVVFGIGYALFKKKKKTEYLH